MYFWGGRPFLAGAISEIRSRAPGMMLLIGLAITVAFVSSWGASLGVLDHQPRLLVGVRAADRDHAAGPLDRDAVAGADHARRWTRWRPCFPMRPSESTGDGSGPWLRGTEGRRHRDRATRRQRARRRRDRRRRRGDRRVDGDRRIPGRCAAAWVTRSSRAPSPPTRSAGQGDRGRRRHRAGGHPAAGDRGAELVVAGAAARRQGGRLAVLVRAWLGHHHRDGVGHRRAGPKRRSSGPSPCW